MIKQATSDLFSVSMRSFLLLTAVSTVLNVSRSSGGFLLASVFDVRSAFLVSEKQANKLLAEPKPDEYIFLITDARDKQIITTATVTIKDKFNQPVEATRNLKTGEWKASLEQTKGYFISIEAPGYMPHEIEIGEVPANKITKPSNKLYPVSLKKNDAATLSLTAIDAITNESVPATFKVVRPEETMLTGKSDKDNPFIIEIGPKKKFTIEVNAEGYKTSTEQLGFENIRSEYQRANIAMKQFALTRETYKFLFKIIDKQTRENMINTRMRIINLKTKQSIAARIEKEGFSANLSPDVEYSVEVESEGYSQTNQNVDLKDLIAKKQFAQEILLEKKTSDIYRLVVVDEETNKNVPGAILRIFNSKNELVTISTTMVQSEWQANLKFADAYTAEIKTKGYIPYNAPIFKDGKTIYFKIGKVPVKETYFLATDFYTKSILPANYKLTTDSNPVTGVLNPEKTRFKALLSADKTYEIEITATGYPTFKETVTPNMAVDNVMVIEMKKETYTFSFNTFDAKTRTPVDKPRVSFVALDSENLALMDNNKTTSPIHPKDFEKKYILRVQADDYKLYTTEINLMSLVASNFSQDVFLEKIEVVQTPVVETKPKLQEPIIVKKEVKTELPKEEKAITPVVISNEAVVSSVSAITDGYFKSIEIGKNIKLENVFFDQSQPGIKPQSYAELDKLVQFLKVNPKVSIEIIGHTDNVGDPRLNLYLSELRAKAVSNYLFNKGISPARLMSTGKGQQQPVASNDTEETRQKNRRVEFMVLSN